MFTEVLEIIKTNYVEEVSEEDLIKKALDGMLVSLDPNSRFLDEDAFGEMQLTTDGEFGGIGVEIMSSEGFLNVISPYIDGPAFEAGIRENDYIIKVDGESIEGMKISEAVKLIRGERGTTVNLTIFREEPRDVFTVDVKRDNITIEAVRAQLIDDKILHIGVGRFSDGVSKQVKDLIASVKSKGHEIEGVLLDFRWNPGGLLDEAYALSNLFLKSGVVVSIKGRNEDDKVVYNASGVDILEGLPMVVLINGGSASASEIVTAALRDNYRAITVGTKSFGKGSVQVVIPFAKDFGIKMTTALYYTPNNIAIEESKGITPDIEIPFSRVEIAKNADKKLDIEEISDEKEEKEETVYNSHGHKLKEVKVSEVEDSQLQRAADLIKGMVIQNSYKAN